MVLFSGIAALIGAEISTTADSWAMLALFTTGGTVGNMNNFSEEKQHAACIKKQAAALNKKVKEFKELWDNLCCKELATLESITGDLQERQMDLVALGADMKISISAYNYTKKKQLIVAVIIVSLVFILFLIKYYSSKSYDNYILKNLSEMHKKYKIGPK
jgi:hypothetical protein